MPCYHPLHGWKARSPSKNGGRAITFKAKDGYTDMPMSVPCGQCIGCRLERSRQWAMRCVHEAGLWKRNCFITLTYRDEDIPAKHSLSVEDYQKFMKRFRKAHKGHQALPDGSRPIRFFHCGEYGSKTQRPHYHAILFNFDFPDKRLFKTVNGCRVYTSKILEDLWGKGFCTVGEMTFESAAYVARYVLKKVTGSAAADHYAGRRPDYVTMSRCPGIASRWYDAYKHDVYCDEGDFIVQRGRKMKPPRFYDSRLRLDSPEVYEYIKRARKAVAALHADDNTEERLAVKEKVKLAQLKYLPRHAEL